MNSPAHWIWIDNAVDYGKKVVYFKREFHMNALPERYEVAVSADSHYLLYVNGQFVSRGPCKGDSYRQYCDRVDLAPFFKQGANCILALVVYFPNEPLANVKFKTGPISVISSSRGGFLLMEEQGNDRQAGLATDMQWLSAAGRGIGFREAIEAKYAGDMEDVDGREYPYPWEAAATAEAEAGSIAWQPASIICGSESSLQGGLLSQWQLAEREIPMLYEQEIHAARVMKSSNGAVEWEQLLQGKAVVIAAGSEEWVELDAGELTTAYISLLLSGALGASVTITYAESYMNEATEGGRLMKGVRDDSQGILQGESDSYLLRDGEQTYEPIFYRTFRFLRIALAAASHPVTVQLKLRETGYPLEAIGDWTSATPHWQQLWDVSVRTLRRCMQDTYVDSPYYERMQYTMDTMLQMLFSYRLSSDDRLARKAIYDFHSSMMPSGLMACNWPAKFRQIIPGFSIYWIKMLDDHYHYYRDEALIARFLPTAEQILHYFISRREEDSGLIADIGYWQYVDWVEEWSGSFGSPVRNKDEINVIYNMMAVYGLRLAARLNGYLGRGDRVRELEAKAGQLSEAIHAAAWSSAAGMYKDVPSREDYSQHAQVWAVLSGIIDGDGARELMLKSLTRAGVAKCSYSMSFFLFRALEKVGLYSHTHRLWDSWIELLDKNVTTWPEDPVTNRSDCHAWGAIPIYEFSACVLGIGPLQPGFEEILVAPNADYFGEASGRAATCWGWVEVQWRAVAGTRLAIEIRLSEPRRTVVVMPDGERKEFNGQTMISWAQQATRQE